MTNIVSQISSIVEVRKNMVDLQRRLGNSNNVVMEGRQVINNLKRSASLFLVKTIFSFLLSLIFMIIPSNYPIVPIQFSLIGSLFIGIPSFVLALQPNRERLSGSFLGDILVSAIPGAMSAVLLVSSISIFEPLFGFTQGQTSTLSMITLGLSFMFVLLKVCLPMNWLRATLFVVMSALFVLSVLILPELLYLTSITPKMLVVAAGAVLLLWPLNYVFEKIANRLRGKIEFS